MYYEPGSISEWVRNLLPWNTVNTVIHITENKIILYFTVSYSFYALHLQKVMSSGSIIPKSSTFHSNVWLITVDCLHTVFYTGFNFIISSKAKKFKLFYIDQYVTTTRLPVYHFIMVPLLFNGVVLVCNV